MILMQGPAVTLTFKVVTLLLRASRRLNLIKNSVKYMLNLTSNNLWAGHEFGTTD